MFQFLNSSGFLPMLRAKAFGHISIFAIIYRTLNKLIPSGSFEPIRIAISLKSVPVLITKSTCFVWTFAIWNLAFSKYLIVRRAVIKTIGQFKVLNSVIKFVVISMVNYFVVAKFSAKEFLHNMSVFKASFFIDSNFFVSARVNPTIRFFLFKLNGYIHGKVHGFPWAKPHSLIVTITKSLAAMRSSAATNFTQSISCISSFLYTVKRIHKLIIHNKLGVSNE